VPGGTRDSVAATAAAERARPRRRSPWGSILADERQHARVSSGARVRGVRLRAFTNAPA